MLAINESQNCFIVLSNAYIQYVNILNTTLFYIDQCIKMFIIVTKHQSY